MRFKVNRQVVGTFNMVPSIVDFVILRELGELPVPDVEAVGAMMTILSSARGESITKKMDGATRKLARSLLSKDHAAKLIDLKAQVPASTTPGEGNFKSLHELAKALRCKESECARKVFKHNMVVFAQDCSVHAAGGTSEISGAILYRDIPQERRFGNLVLSADGQPKTLEWMLEEGCWSARDSKDGDCILDAVEDAYIV